MPLQSALTRRTFLSLSAALAATAATSRVVDPFTPTAHASILNPGVTKTSSFCEICFWKCGIDVWKDAKGRVTQITGMADHPPEQRAALSAGYGRRRRAV